MIAGPSPAPSAAPDAPPRERILAAATAVIRRGGVREVRVQAVAAAAGVSTPLVYHYFGNRDGLVRAALSGVVGAAAEPPSGPSPRDRVLALLAGGVDDAPERRAAAAMRNELAASALFDPELAALLAADTARREAAVVAALGGAVGGPDDAALAARGLVGLADGLVERWLGGLLPADRLRALLARAVDATVAP